AVMLALPLFGGMWTGFTELPISGKLSPIYATYPIAFDEISGLLFKVNTLRILLWSPFFIAIGVAILRVYSVEPRTAFVYSLVSLYGLVTFQPFQWCGKFSSGSNDSKVTKLRPILAITALVFGFLLFGGLFVFVLAVPPYWNIASALAMPITSLATWLIYRWAYNTPSFDLVHDVRGH
ncbi:MAG TPA: hypothetical protein VG897_03155, partial [Terriglobales bacterium]|nr:hypothetical protein [Terriglobales bacterium]